MSFMTPLNQDQETRKTDAKSALLPPYQDEKETHSSHAQSNMKLYKFKSSKSVNEEQGNELVKTKR